jgi:pyruvate/2-oxoglutarate/acetoin dehydrogenase E1 component
MQALALEFSFRANMSKYSDELTRAMDYLADKPDTKFIGQSVAVAGTAMRNTLLNVDESKLIEFPVDEELQMGVSVGMALAGYVPISIFPRWNFLLVATNQIVNHLDKLKEITQVENPGKVIIRTGIGSEKPLYPGPQHTGDFTKAFQLMCPHMNVVRLDDSSSIFDEYKLAYERDDGISTILVEWGDKYAD